MGGLPESILSGDDTGISQYCNQKQYINTVITGQNEDEIQAIKTMARTGLAEDLSCSSQEQDPVWIISMKRDCCMFSLEKRAGMNQTIYVDNDNVLAGREAEYLLNLGHVRIA